ncbi:MAG: M3 family oligoendopeptidase [Bacilli bacterium]
MYTWNLDRLYQGLDDPKWTQDLQIADELIAKQRILMQQATTMVPHTFLKESLLLEESLDTVFSTLFQFVSLSLATDVANVEYNNALLLLRKKAILTTLPRTQFEKYIGSLTNLEAIIDQDPYLQAYRFILLETQQHATHLMSNEEEVLASELGQSGGSLYSKMQGDLTSTLEVTYRNTIITLSKVRNLAYDRDSAVRKDAYYAELAGYEKIAKPMSYALHGIKKEVLTLSKKRQFASPLEETLHKSRLTSKALDALLQAIQQSLPHFRRYMKRKGELLGHKDGLPFYDLFAPMGSMDKEYSIEDAQAFILKHFASFSSDLHDMAKRAFNESWVDYLPKDGKRGGAFCSSIYPLHESRILTNYGNTMGDISTLAHELGHAYHNLHIGKERILNTSYPMPIAETASILCETIVKKAAIKEATTTEERLGMLEQELQDATQVIVDIYSRYLFESVVFSRSDNEFLNETTLDNIMSKAQLDSYGDGLCSSTLHPRMWINKGHYYSTGRSFYNFPYAFGLLFAKGIYAKYQEKGPKFVASIQNLLRHTGKQTLVDVAKSIDIDIEKVDYWQQALSVIQEDIDEFLLLTK